MAEEHNPTNPLPEDAEQEDVVYDITDDLPEDEEQAKAQFEDDIASLQEQLLRAKADYANYTRVAERNVANTREQTTMGLARALVPVLDTFDLTMQQDAEGIDPVELLKGVGLVRDQLVAALSGFGLQPVHAEPGDALDPNLHTALMRQPHDDIESGHIVQQLQPGYTVNGKPVRPAQVIVAE